MRLQAGEPGLPELRVEPEVPAVAQAVARTRGAAQAEGRRMRR